MNTEKCSWKKMSTTIMLRFDFELEFRNNSTTFLLDISSSLSSLQ